MGGGGGWGERRASGTICVGVWPPWPTLPLPPHVSHLLRGLVELAVAVRQLPLELGHDLQWPEFLGQGAGLHDEIVRSQPYRLHEGYGLVDPVAVPSLHGLLELVAKVRVRGVYGATQLLDLVLIVRAGAAVDEAHDLRVRRPLRSGGLGVLQGGLAGVGLDVEGGGVLYYETPDDGDVLVVAGGEVEGLVARVVHEAEEALPVGAGVALVNYEGYEVAGSLPLDGVMEGCPSEVVHLEDLVQEPVRRVH
mmetsp:Transcript_19892/g.41335  ORF Transcript_19892/g.41335 Transcript_19892/m.41335 type:complete len:250 (+) Transcript_19892:251-1000(+)